MRVRVEVWRGMSRSARAFMSGDSSLGQPMTEKGNKPEENQVSSTSGSCFSVILSAHTPFFLTARSIA